MSEQPPSGQDAAGHHLDPYTEQDLQDQRDLQTLMAAMKRWEKAPRFDLMLRPYEAWVLMAGVQLCLRHPELSPDLREILTRVGRRLQPLVCDTADIDDVAERGWDPGQDRDARPATPTEGPS